MGSGQTVIQVEHLAKRYLIGHGAGRPDGAESFREAAARAVRSVARRTADLVRGRQMVDGDAVEAFWALRDVSFDVRQGEVVGIIGRNGAGKSTLLKILSRITEPTEGRVRIRGRVASLLEVGTGFHPELSGRENIFLNGAVLGMTKQEIRASFDNIVSFAEIAEFIDTPVKRYSSGMYVRLAFAVAAHLTPEILILDEILAVGDALFQNKCLGKIGEVAKAGRTILLVSHNMGIVQALADRCVWLKDGMAAGVGAPVTIISKYLGHASAASSLDVSNQERLTPHHGRTVRISILLARPRNGVSFLFGEDLVFEIRFTATRSLERLRFGATISDAAGVAVLNTFSPATVRASAGRAGSYRLTVRDPRLAPGSYSIGISIGEGSESENRFEHDIVKNGPGFSIASLAADGTSLFRWRRDYGYVVHTDATAESIDEQTHPLPGEAAEPMRVPMLQVSHGSAGRVDS